MARADFAEQLTKLGYDVTDLGEGKASIPFTISTGRFSEKQINLGFVVPEDFPLTPPSGPHISPRLFPIQSGGTHPSGGIHDSPFGSEWEYWSRPLSHWSQTKRTAKDVLAHIRHLFDTIP